MASWNFKAVCAEMASLNFTRVSIKAPARRFIVPLSDGRDSPVARRRPIDGSADQADGKSVLNICRAYRSIGKFFFSAITRMSVSTY